MRWTHIEDTAPKGRKAYRCILCDQMIPAGEPHVARRGFTEDGPLTMRMHFACEARTHGWDEWDWEMYEPGEFLCEMRAEASKAKRDGEA